MLQVFVIAESQVLEDVVAILVAIGDAATPVSVAAPATVVARLPAGIPVIPLSSDAGFGAALTACLSAWDGTSHVLVIRAGSTCDNWRGLVVQCHRCHESIEQLGVWSPRTTPSSWDVVVVKALTARISAVAAVDSSVVGMSPPVVRRLTALGIPAAAPAPEIWEAAVAAAYARSLLVLRDDVVSIRALADRRDEEAALATGSEIIAVKLLPEERRQLDKLRGFVSVGRHRPRQRVIDLEVDAGLAGCTTPFDVLERMHTGRSEHHVGPPDSLGVNLVPNVQLTAFYLPQFHRLEVNDQAWGSGFTEWNNVTRCQPYFRGHLQPHIPADLGYYDLSNPDVIARQTRLALHYGVGAFCFHYYWFGGHVVMPTPLRLFREIDDPHMNFCICWANENWTKRWDGREAELILRQAHAHELDRRLIRDILPLLQSRRYLRANGAAVIVIYRPALLGDDLGRTLDSWRRVAEAEGVGPLLILGSNFVEEKPSAARLERELDGVVEFPPHGHFGAKAGLAEATFYRRVFEGSFHDYDDVVTTFGGITPTSDNPTVPGVFPGWDNSARRRGHAHIYVNSSPPKFRAWVAAALRRSLANPAFDGMVFINAWNEWAEGAHLEPCRWYGHAHLAACRDAIHDVLGAESRTGS